MRARPLLALLALLSAAPASAAEPGCGAFAWHLSAERSLMEGAAAGSLPSGGRVATVPSAFSLSLTRGGAGLPRAPERAPRDEAESWSGFAIVEVPAEATYRVTLAAEAWIDVLQDGVPARAATFTGARDCPGLRKSVTFRLRPGPATVQVSGARQEAVRVALTPDRVALAPDR